MTQNMAIQSSRDHNIHIEHLFDIAQVQAKIGDKAHARATFAAIQNAVRDYYSKEKDDESIQFMLIYSPFALSISNFLHFKLPVERSTPPLPL